MLKYFTLEYYLGYWGFTKANRLEIAKNEPITDEDIERIDISFVETTRKVVRWLSANGTDVGAVVTADVAGVIGSSVNIQSRIKDSKDLNESIEDYIDEWSESCEVTGRFHLNSALRAMVEFTDKDGGFLMRHHYDPKWSIPYKFELIEVGMIDINEHDEDNRVLNGIKTDKYGSIIGVYIYNSQERDKSSMVKYDDLTFFSPVWISLSQYTAVSKFSSFLPTVDKMEQYTDSELQKVIEEAKAGKYWQTSMYDDVMKIVKATKDENVRKTQLSTIMKTIGESAIKPHGLTPIPLGDDIVKTENVKPSVYPNMNKIAKGNIASSQGLSSQIVYQDSSDSNYSSIKAMMAFASIQWNIRWDDLEKMVVNPMFRRLITVGVMKKAIVAPNYFANPRKYLKLEYMRVTEIDIEPAKTATADEKKLKAKTTSKREICRRKGRNYEDVLREQIEDELLEEEMRKELNAPKKTEEGDEDAID